MDAELTEIWGVDYDGFVSRLLDTLSVDGSGVVLDVATGPARIPQSIAQRLGQGSYIYGLDITPAMLEYGQSNIQAQGLSSEIRLVCGSGMEMPFDDQTFNLVICALGMHHMDVPQALTEMRRVMKKDGRLFLSAVGALPSWRSSWKSAFVKAFTFLWFSITNKQARARAEVEAFANVFTREEWQVLLVEHGFSKIEIDIGYQGRRPWYPNALFMGAERTI